MNKHKVITIVAALFVFAAIVLGIDVIIAADGNPVPASSPNTTRAQQGSAAVVSDAAADAPCIDPQEPAVEKAAADGRNRWQKKELTVAFLDGGQNLRQRVIQAAKEWEAPSRMTFSFGTQSNSDIRVSFAHRGHYSQIGNMASRIDPERETMNLQFTDRTSTPDVKMITLHEFGHALGLIHEHQSPASSIDWNEPEVMAYYSGGPNYWDRLKIRHNVLEKYQHTQTMRASGFDRTSIMLYPIQKRFTTNGFSSDWNRELSPTDRAFIREFYKGLFAAKPIENVINQNERVAASSR